MTQVFKPNEWFRRSFSIIPNAAEVPPLMYLQTHSFEEFLQMDVPPAKRENMGPTGSF